MLKKVLLALPFLTSTALFAVDADVPPPQSMWHTLIMIGIAIAFFYLLLWRPEQKRRKALDDQRASIKQGDRVVAMGIIGTVVRIQEETLILKLYDGAKVEVLKGAITDVTPAASEPDIKLVEKDG